MAEYVEIEVAATDLGDTARLKPHIYDKLAFPNVELQKLTRLLTLLGVDPVSRMQYRIFDDVDPSREATVTAVSAAAANIFLDLRDGLVEGDTLGVRTSTGRPLGFTMRVNATPSTGAGEVDVTPGRPEAGIDESIPVNSVVFKIANVRSEDDTAPTARHRASGSTLQQCSFIARAITVTLLVQNAAYYGIPEVARIDAQQLRQWAIDVEQSLKNSIQATNTTNTGATVWHTDGHRQHALTYNHVDCNGSLGHETFVRGLQRSSRYGKPGDKWVFGGSRFADGLSRWPLQYDIARQDALSDKFGFEVKTFIIPGFNRMAHYIHDETMEDQNELAVYDLTDMSIAEHIPMTIDRGPSGYGIQTPGSYRHTWQIYRALGLRCGNRWNQLYFTTVDRIVP